MDRRCGLDGVPDELLGLRQIQTCDACLNSVLQRLTEIGQYHGTVGVVRRCGRCRVRCGVHRAIEEQSDLSAAARHLRGDAWRSSQPHLGPAYRFAIQLHQPQAGHPAGSLAEPPFTFIRTLETATPQHEWEPQTEVTVPRQFAALLGLEPHIRMLSRSVKVSMDGEPTLTSTSYVPIELADDQGWQDVQAGQLAVVGHEVRSEFWEDEQRMPTPHRTRRPRHA